jgi:hypothetical protein
MPVHYFGALCHPKKVVMLSGFQTTTSSENIVSAQFGLRSQVRRGETTVRTEFKLPRQNICISILYTKNCPSVSGKCSRLPCTKTLLHFTPVHVYVHVYMCCVHACIYLTRHSTRMNIIYTCIYVNIIGKDWMLPTDLSGFSRSPPSSLGVKLSVSHFLVCTKPWVQSPAQQT